MSYEIEVETRNGKRVLQTCVEWFSACLAAERYAALFTNTLRIYWVSRTGRRTLRATYQQERKG